MNIDKYLDNITFTENGEVYKNEDAYKEDWDAICYISEYALNALVISKEDGIDLTDEQIIKEGEGSTHNTIRTQIMASYEISEAVIDYLSLDDDIFGIVDWQYVSTYLDEYDLPFYKLPIGSKVKYKDIETGCLETYEVVSIHYPLEDFIEEDTIIIISNGSTETEVTIGDIII